MKDWNVVISVFQDGFRRAVRALVEFGPIQRSPYHNVLIMKVDDPVALLNAIEKKTEASTALYDAISRVAPSQSNIEFVSADAFKAKAQSKLREWSSRLGGRSFHVRLRRRGTRLDLATPDIERFLDDGLLDALKQAGTPGAISFDDPDAVVAIDIVDDRAGLALWTREDLARHPLLRPD